MLLLMVQSEPTPHMTFSPSQFCSVDFVMFAVDLFLNSSTVYYFS